VGIRLLACLSVASPKLRFAALSPSLIMFMVPFAISPTDHDNRTDYSGNPKRLFRIALRSNSDDVNVGAICSLYGGGGHVRAAGFTFVGDSISALFMPKESKSSKSKKGK
jgi:hypothetical protein